MEAGQTTLTYETFAPNELDPNLGGNTEQSVNALVVRLNLANIEGNIDLLQNHDIVVTFYAKYNKEISAETRDSIVNETHVIVNHEDLTG